MSFLVANRPFARSLFACFGTSVDQQEQWPASILFRPTDLANQFTVSAKHLLAPNAEAAPGNPVEVVVHGVGLRPEPVLDTFAFEVRLDTGCCQLGVKGRKDEPATRPKDS